MPNAGCGYAYYRTSTRTTNKKIFYYRCVAGSECCQGCCWASRRCTDCSLYFQGLDTGLRRRALHPDAASLLPGSLATTWTGLPPVGGDDLADTHAIRPSNPPPSDPIARALWTRSSSSSHG